MGPSLPAFGVLSKPLPAWQTVDLPARGLSRGPYYTLLPGEPVAHNYGLL